MKKRLFLQLSAAVLIIILVAVIATPSIAAPEVFRQTAGFTDNTTFSIHQFKQMEVRRTVQVLYSRDGGATVSFYLRNVPELDVPGSPNGGSALDTFKFEATADDNGIKFVSFCADIGAVGVEGSYVIDETNHGFSNEQMHTLVAVIDYVYDEYGFGGDEGYGDGQALVQLILWNLIIRYTDGPLIADLWIRDKDGFWLYTDEYGAIYKIEGYNNTNGSRYWYTPEYRALINDILADTDKYVAIYDAKISAAKPYEKYISEAVFLIGDGSFDYIHQQRQLILLFDEFIPTPPETEKITVRGVKTWRDDDNPLRPSEITVLLLRDGAEFGRQTVSAPWTFEFTGLDKFSADGEHEYDYTVDEIVPAGYTKNVDGTTITNTYNGGGPGDPEKTSISGSKVWDDSNYAGRPTEITVLLLRDGAEFGRQTVSAPWTFEFTGLDKFTADGEHGYDYTVDEIVPAGYTRRISGTTITNTRAGAPPTEPPVITPSTPPPVTTTTITSTPPADEETGTTTTTVPPIETGPPEDTNITIIDDGPPTGDFDPGNKNDPPPREDDFFVELPDDDVPLGEMPATGVETGSMQLALIGLVILLSGVQAGQRRRRGAK